MLDFFRWIAQAIYSVFTVLFSAGFYVEGTFVSIGAVLISCTLVSLLIFAFWRGVQK